MCFSLVIINPLECRGNYIATSTIWSWYTGRWWVGCYIWYSEEGPGYYGTLIGNPTPGIQWYNFRPPGVTPNRGMGPPWGAFCQITLTSCLDWLGISSSVWDTTYVLSWHLIADNVAMCWCAAVAEPTQLLGSSRHPRPTKTADYICSSGESGSTAPDCGQLVGLFVCHSHFDRSMQCQLGSQ